MTTRPWLYNTEDKEFVGDVVKSFNELDAEAFEALILKATEPGSDGPFGKETDPVFWLIYNINNNFWSESGNIKRTESMNLMLLDSLSAHSDKVSNLSKNFLYFMMDSVISPDVLKNFFGKGGDFNPERLSQEDYQEYKPKLELALDLKVPVKAFVTHEQLTTIISLMPEQLEYHKRLQSDVGNLSPKEFIRFAANNERRVVECFSPPVDLYTSDQLPAALHLRMFPPADQYLPAIQQSIRMESDKAFDNLVSKPLSPAESYRMFGNGSKLWNLVPSAKEYTYNDNQLKMIDAFVISVANAMSAFIEPDSFIEFIKNGEIKGERNKPFTLAKLFGKGPIRELLKADVSPGSKSVAQAAAIRLIREEDVGSLDLFLPELVIQHIGVKTAVYDTEDFCSKLKYEVIKKNPSGIKTSMLNSIESAFEAAIQEVHPNYRKRDDRMEEHRLLDRLDTAFFLGDDEGLKEVVAEIRANTPLLHSPDLMMSFQKIQQLTMMSSRHDDQESILKRKPSLELIKKLMIDSVSGICDSLAEIKPRHNNRDFDNDLNSFSL
jgi:hypothetical protein